MGVDAGLLSLQIGDALGQGLEFALFFVAQLAHFGRGCRRHGGGRCRYSFAGCRRFVVAAVIEVLRAFLPFGLGNGVGAFALD